MVQLKARPQYVCVYVCVNKGNNPLNREKYDLL